MVFCVGGGELASLDAARIEVIFYHVCYWKALTQVCDIEVYWRMTLGCHQCFSNHQYHGTRVTSREFSKQTRIV